MSTIKIIKYKKVKIYMLPNGNLHIPRDKFFDCTFYPHNNKGRQPMKRETVAAYLWSARVELRNDG